MIIGGKSAFYKFDLQSYVLGALALYVDIINIFAILSRNLSSHRYGFFSRRWLSLHLLHRHVCSFVGVILIVWQRSLCLVEVRLSVFCGWRANHFILRVSWRLRNYTSVLCKVRLRFVEVTIRHGCRPLKRVLVLWHAINHMSLNLPLHLNVFRVELQ